MCAWSDLALMGLTATDSGIQLEDWIVLGLTNRRRLGRPLREVNLNGGFRGRCKGITAGRWEGASVLRRMRIRTRCAGRRTQLVTRGSAMVIGIPALAREPRGAGPVRLDLRRGGSARS